MRLRRAEGRAVDAPAMRRDVAGGARDAVWIVGQMSVARGILVEKNSKAIFAFLLNSHSRKNYTTLESCL